MLSIVRLYRSVAPPLSQQLYYTRVPRAVGASHPAISAEAKNATSAVQAGLDIAINDLEAHYLAGGNVVRVVNAMISADKANIPLPFKRAAAIDLAGRDVLEAVKMSVIPKGIETPKIAAVAKDGIQLIAVSRVTVRTNIDRLVGGAGEETIIARVGEEIENIGAKLQIAQAQLEEQRAMAAAFRQGNLVKTPRSAVSTGRPQEGNRA